MSTSTKTHSGQLVKSSKQLVEHLDQLFSSAARREARKTNNVSKEDADILAPSDFEVTELISRFFRLLLFLVLGGFAKYLNYLIHFFISHVGWQDGLDETVLNRREECVSVSAKEGATTTVQSSACIIIITKSSGSNNDHHMHVKILFFSFFFRFQPSTA